MSYTTIMNRFLLTFKNFQSILVLILVLAVPSILSGCSGKSVDETDPAQLFKEANEDISSDHYLLAIDKLKMIKNKYPYSNYALDASLRLADVYFMQESFAEAALAYESFRDLHPKHPKVSYAMFRVGLSYFNDAPTNVARDLTVAQKAQDAFNEFLHRFPTDPNVEEAKKDLAESRRLLAAKELYVGNFYFRRRLYDSAKKRFEKLLQLYPETAPATEAREKITQLERGGLHNEE